MDQSIRDRLRWILSNYDLSAYVYRHNELLAETRGYHDHPEVPFRNALFYMARAIYGYEFTVAQQSDWLANWADRAPASTMTESYT